MRLGVIDNNRPDWVPELVTHLDRLGYSRYWATEQHSSYQSGSPTVLTAIAGGLSGRMRVGTAGVLLNLYSPWKVAEDFRLLQLMFAGRVDLGVTGGVAAEPVQSALLDGRPPLDPRTYAAKVRTLVRLMRRERDDTGMSGGKLGPRCGGTPDLWLCGSSMRSALLAAELGICYAFHDRAVSGPATGPNTVVDERYSGTEVVRAYVNAFQPHRTLREPRFTVALYGICASTSAEAESLWRTRGREDDSRPGFCGDPEQCRRQLEDLQRRYQTDELIIQTITRSFDACMTSYELLANACHLD
jgi:luciferase family oxidoreductase group 1